MSSPSGTGEGSTSHFPFDNLFRRVLGENRALAQALVECGFDPDHPAERYPVGVWSRCLERARMMLFSHLPVTEGLRQLGHLAAGGLEQGPLGVAYAGIPLTHEMYLRRLPWLMRQARADVEVEMACLGPRRWQVEMRHPEPIPYFTIGILEERMRNRGIPATVELVREEPTRFVVEIRW
jgi:uncharacterized protein (TIGR02265 family)